MPPPNYIQLGPLTRTIADEAKWRDEDLFPAWQCWADEVERVLRHIEMQGRFATILPRLRDVDAKHRDAKLAEARVSFWFHRNGFRILEYDPPGADGNEGDLMIQWNQSEPIFVEVKAPSWRGELFPTSAEGRTEMTRHDRDWALKRLQQQKDIDLETRWIDPIGQALHVIEENALKKLMADTPNLVVVADDFFVTPIQFSTYLEGIVLKSMVRPEFNRLGGILFFKPQVVDSEVDYKMYYIDNPNAITACRLPEPIRLGLLSSTAEVNRRRRRIAGAS